LFIFAANFTVNSMNVAIDWGNSSLKAGWFDEDRLVHTDQFATVEGLAQALIEHPAHDGIVSSTSRPAETLQTELAGLGIVSWLFLNGQTSVPIHKDYDTPHMLGADRVAAAVGAMHLYPGEDCLILDLGTCITADRLDGDGVFRGGLISPGLRMRLQAMHQLTARLPLLEIDPSNPPEWPRLDARNTREAMLSGALNGMRLELDGIVTEYWQQYPNGRVLLCGGDGPLFESRLKPPIFAVPPLVLWGLNRILHYNVKKLPANP
jgi:type III pantothenate kinase